MTGYSISDIGAEVWGQPGTVSELLNSSSSFDLPVCFSFWMVVGSTRVDYTKWDIPIGDPISRAKHHSCSESSVHFYDCPSFTFPPLFLKVWSVSLLCGLDHHHDHCSHPLSTWNQRSPHWGDGIFVEEALVLEKDSTSTHRSWCNWCVGYYSSVIQDLVYKSWYAFKYKWLCWFNWWKFYRVCIYTMTMVWWDEIYT